MKQLSAPAEQLLQALQGFRAQDARWREGRVWAGVYDAGAEAEALSKAAYTEFLSENALYINLYPSVLALEREVVGWMKTKLRAPADGAGNFTSGGTESITLAMKAARDHARALRGISAGEVVLCRTTHPAFHKAAHLLGLSVRITEMDAHHRADPAAYAAALTPNTVMLVASAPCYSHGVVDPVEAIAALAQQHGLWMHVDACVGGLYLSTMRELGHDVPAFDFTVPGISSMSCDLHKYGYTAKNASVVLFASRALRQHALYANAHTTGYALVNSTIASSRSGGPMAAAWATTQLLGTGGREGGYARIVRDTWAATQRLREAMGRIPGLRVLGDPVMCMFTVACDGGSVFVIEDAMLDRGWHVQTQFQAPGTPANLHLSVNASNVAQVEAFIADLVEATAQARATPAIDVAPLVQQVLKAVSESARSGQPPPIEGLLAALGAEGGAMPSRWAPINTLLDALPDAVVDALLVAYANTLYA
jgi:sphinganine-1-phosphate aldolase